MINSTACQTAPFCVQRSWEFCGEEQWANDEFFETYEKAELYIIQMSPFWDRREKARIVPTSELDSPKGWWQVQVYPFHSPNNHKDAPNVSRHQPS